MPWRQLTLELDRGDVERFEEVLFATGALAVTARAASADSLEPVLEPGVGETPLWKRVRLAGLYPESVDIDAIHMMLDALVGEAPAPQWELIEDRAWEREWLKRFRPMRFGRRLWVCPSGTSPPSADAIGVMIDPGLAFGTGTHPTTALCLEWLDRHLSPGCRLLDFGCGSGILAIAALKLGAREAVAVDHDPQALEATATNAARNGVADRLLVCAPEAMPPSRFDALVSNILAEPLAELVPIFAQRLEAGATAVLSGVLECQVHQLVTAFRKCFDIEQVISRAGWSRVTVIRHRTRN